jgi:hypothetical protein
MFIATKLIFNRWLFLDYRLDLKNIFSSLLVIFIVAATVSALTHYLNVGGELRDSSNEVLTGDHNLTFRLYNESTGGTLKWEENHTDSNEVTVNDGYFSIALGSLNTLELDFNENYWLEVIVDGETLAPRHRVGASGYSFNSKPNCPLGMVDVSGEYCIDNSLSASTGTWNTHFLNCKNNGKRLCTFDEWWRAINDVSGLNTTICPTEGSLDAPAVWNRSYDLALSGLMVAELELMSTFPNCNISTYIEDEDFLDKRDGLIAYDNYLYTVCCLDG